MNPTADPIRAEIVAHLCGEAEALCYLEDPEFGQVAILAAGLAPGRGNTPTIGERVAVAVIRLPPRQSGHAGICLASTVIVLEEGFWGNTLGAVATWDDPWRIADLKPHFPCTTWDTGFWHPARPMSFTEHKLDKLCQYLENPTGPQLALTVGPMEDKSLGPLEDVARELVRIFHKVASILRGNIY